MSHATVITPYPLTTPIAMDRRYTPASASSGGTDEPASTDSTRDPTDGNVETDSRYNAATRQSTTNSSERRPPESPTVESDSVDGGRLDNTFSAVSRMNSAPTSLKERGERDKKKGVSFLSRIIGSKRRGVLPTHSEDASDAGDSRAEGMDAHLFSHSADNLGYSPQYPQPPQYIKVRSKFKRKTENDHLFLAQQLRGGNQKANTFPLVGRAVQEPLSQTARDDPIWALEFSKDGKYLAAAGHDKKVRVWAVLSSPEERGRFEETESTLTGAQGGGPNGLSAPVFHSTPFKVYTGHESTIIDLSWSKNNFLLSSSFDKTVRLWHISRDECLCTFKHSEYVPSIQFHPRDDRFFLAGSLDCKLRLWSIPDKSVAYWAQLPEMITAVAFTPDGRSSIAGTLGGQLYFYETESLKYSTHIHARSNRGKNSRGSKITNIQAMNFPPDKEYGDIKVLVSSNDSRVRLYNLQDKSLQVKFKGHVNNETQIRATFSDDGRYVISGSEDKKTYVWSIDPGDAEKGEQPFEVFESNTSMTIASLLAPTKTRHVLSASEDPIYDLCNPPPVTLVSRDESLPSRPASESGSGGEKPSPAETTTKPARGSPAYVARCAHPGGHIIVTAGYSGCIRVYRQDCAYTKRKHAGAWDASSAFSKRTGGSGKAATPRIPFGGGLARSGSQATRTSNGATRSMTALAPMRSRRDSDATQPPSDRILSWRQDIAANSSTSVDNPHAMRRSTSLRKGRSVSPRQSSGQVSQSSAGRGGPVAAAKPQPAAAEPVRPLSQRSRPVIVTEMAGEQSLESGEVSPTNDHRRSSESKEKDARADAPGNRTYSFWNPSVWRRESSGTQSSESPVRRRSTNHDPKHLSADFPSLDKKSSIVSTLSSEEESIQERLSAESGRSGEQEEAEVRCRKCSGTSFKAKMVDRPTTGRRKCFVCSRCGTAL